jgi:hypothetical protein
MVLPWNSKIAYENRCPLQSSESFQKHLAHTCTVLPSATLQTFEAKLTDGGNPGRWHFHNSSPKDI